jgi:ketosteroid isomerase-like protein
MLTRDQVLSAVDAIYAARVKGDKEAVSKLWAADATFQLVGEESILRSMPVTPQNAHTSISQMIDTFTFHSVERVESLVEGNRVAIVIRIIVSSCEDKKHEMLLYDLWELNDQGQAKSLMEFSDTAMVATMLTEAGTA